ncbi:MAG: hypothetical protein E4H16_01180, partial [Candidatus Atribacteria bacterium]
MEEKLKTLVLGGLLRDSGKLLQRSGFYSGDQADCLAALLKSEAIEISDRQAGLNCAAYRGAGGNKHVELTPDSPAYLVHEAGLIAAGLDSEEGSKDAEPVAHLQSVFNLVGERSKVSEAVAMKPLDAFQAINYPEQKWGSRPASKESYGVLTNRWINGLKRMNLKEGSHDALLGLMESVFSTVPANPTKGGESDISQYDCSRMTAAIAVCMAQYLDSKGLEDYSFLAGDGAKPFREEDVFCLVSGDLSGIQDYIYTISSKNALKALRGRSLYLEL